MTSGSSRENLNSIFNTLTGFRFFRGLTDISKSIKHLVRDMKNIRFRLADYFRFSYRIFLINILFLFAMVLSSCEKKMGVLKNTDILSLPTTTVKDFESVFTDSTKIQFVLTSPLMEGYSRERPPYTIFRNGIKAEFYDGHDKPVASITSKYAKLYEDKNLWELKDSVRAINEKNEKLETDLLFWDRDKDLFYTDRFVRITSEDQIVMGIGMKSNSRFTDWWIRNVSAIIPISDEE
jgi:LPS export ABC transporter protein LptC